MVKLEMSSFWCFLEPSFEFLCGAISANSAVATQSALKEHAHDDGSCVVPSNGGTVDTF